MEVSMHLYVLSSTPSHGLNQYIEIDSEESESKFVWQCMTEGALTTGAEPTPTRPAHRVA